MEPASPSFELALAGLRAGEQDAAQRIYEKFIDRLVQLAADKLNPNLGAVPDSEGVAQSVMATFFVRHARGKYVLYNWGMVFGLLSHITFRKCLNRNRDLRAARRGGGADAVAFEDWQKATTAPGPDEEAMVAELLEDVLSRFDTDERAILDAYLAESTVDAVAAQVKLSTRTVQRILERFRTQLLRTLTDA